MGWMPAFLDSLAQGTSVKAAAREAGINSSTVYWHRNRKAWFAREWNEAQGEVTPEGADDGDGRRSTHWRKTFIDALGETSNVTAAAAAAHVQTREVYKLRRKDPAFAANWLTALHEGYDNLEMELLGYLRGSRPERKMDVGAALRLLAAHRATVERRRALLEEEDEQAVFESIDRFIDDMRVRRAANDAILIEMKPADAGE